jgi:predicted ATPase
MAELKSLLKGTRLLTLTGSGGAGKTRLSLQIGADLIDDFADGVFFIELAPLSESSYIIHELASTFSLRESGSKNPRDELISFLRGKEMLIILITANIY